MPSAHDILKEYWGYDAFRPLQEDIIRTVLEDGDALALLPTGGGKSLCYQVPALAREGICLVISPLIALMKDQVEGLKKRGILAAAIYSGQSRRAIVQTLKNVAHGPYKLLYVSPERLETGLFREYLPALHVNLIAVDEAHCISQWGYDFRPAYRRIAALRAELPGVPVLALTASATVEVQEDICAQLGMEGAAQFRQPFLRPNLSYSAYRTDARMNRLADILKKVPGSAIVYCKSRRRTVEVARLLELQGESAAHYHAGLTQEERTGRQQDWIDGRTRIIVCTNAFGMGIDKPDVRLVLHADVPDCLESYYQEAGRAGRDGKKSYAVLLYTDGDLRDLEGAHVDRFPNLEQVRTVYSALVNYLQIPSYYGKDQSYTFHFDPFVRNFKLNGHQAHYALKAMESDGWFDLNEKSFQPPTVIFTCTQESLRGFMEAHPELEPVLTLLLRTYAGVWDGPVLISEGQLAKLMPAKEGDIKAQLQRAAAFGVIDYRPLNEDPQLIFRHDRVNTEHFYMDMSLYNGRREAFRGRVQAMIAYTGSTECRSTYINRYFGDADKTPCGICDNCLARKRAPLSPEAFAAIGARIRDLLHARPLPVEELLSALKDVRREQLWTVIERLQAEEQLRTDREGRLCVS